MLFAGEASNDTTVATFEEQDGRNLPIFRVNLITDNVHQYHMDKSMHECSEEIGQQCGLL